MKNKVDLKRCLIQIAAVVIIFGIGFAVLNYYEYHKYTVAYNQKITAILGKIQKEYKGITETELMQILESDSENLDISKYGIDVERGSIIEENEVASKRFLLIHLFFIMLFAIVIACCFLNYNRKKDKQLEQITKYIEEINQRNYKLDIDDISEDELSILKNEIYKTTVMLKEVAEHSVKAKNDLKESLSDISHQLKTPLTSILIILDDMIDDPEMPAEIRQDFIRDIKREITNINFLVQSLLKLSKLDSDTVVFVKEEVAVDKIVDSAVQNVATLCDLKNVTIERQRFSENQLLCDFRWQVEAITNILKNCVEHSPEGERIIIKTEKNNVYMSVSIRDFGRGIDEEDLKHIFERFYKGKNATQDSVGIGLALAKAIVETDRGHISVESGKNGTKFTVKYFYV